MRDAQDILLDNFKETLALVQRLLLTGLTSALFLLSLAVTNPTLQETGEPARDPVLGIRAPNVLLAFVGVGIYWTVGLGSVSFVRRARSLAAKLAPELHAAALTHPSILTLSLAARLALALAPGILGMVAYYLFYRHSHGAADLLPTAPLVAIPYGILAWRVRQDLPPPERP